MIEAIACLGQVQGGLLQFRLFGLVRVQQPVGQLAANEVVVSQLGHEKFLQSKTPA
ncbi:hypothetical protein [Pseudomonas sp. OA65]|uniref:hypothetical protein n=1 Tax=Pseudomonas sp. OA65 TaxID=2818431 RepID=UPI001A9F61A9|nr:hypothetical protein [Pseudomonas sp. OA65]MBO1538491.1 hypothetical protein [Pseudomonas sp. OA65]